MGHVQARSILGTVYDIQKVKEIMSLSYDKHFFIGYDSKEKSGVQCIIRFNKAQKSRKLNNLKDDFVRKCLSSTEFSFSRFMMRTSRLGIVYGL